MNADRELRTMTHASICSGIDGPALAASWLGWENSFYAEINEFCLTVLKYYHPNARRYTDIRTTDFTEWRGKIDVLSAGFPCQPFSVAGQRTGEKHDSYLWPETLRVVREVRPRWFIGENVNGITSMVLPGEEIKVAGQTDIFGEENALYERTDRYIIDRICCDLENLGYETVPVVIPACAVGAPHERARCFFIAYDAENSMCNGRNSSEWQEESKAGRQRDFRSGDNERIYREQMSGTTANSECKRRNSKRPERNRSEENEGEWSDLFFKSNRLSKEQPASDAQGVGQERRHRQGKEGWRQSEIRAKSSDGAGFWDNFPTQSPVRYRNDGFSGGLSGITLSKWRTESITSLGNAIVPQQIYEIYYFIDIIEKQK